MSLSKGHLSGASILLVDDDDQVRDSVADILRGVGCAVLEAPDASTAVALIDGRAVDVILTDIFMPGGDGFEMINEIRRRNLHVPVIVMSGGGERVGGDYLKLAGRLGAVETLAKPFTPRQLTNAVARALGRPDSGA